MPSIHFHGPIIKNIYPTAHFGHLGVLFNLILGVLFKDQRETNEIEINKKKIYQNNKVLLYGNCFRSANAASRKVDGKRDRNIHFRVLNVSI